MSDVDNKVKMIVEGCLLAAGRPLTLDNIIAVFEKSEQPDRDELKQVMQAISEDCNDRGFELKQVASGYRFQVKQDLSEWVAKLWEERPPRYTRALLETLALVTYRQPITRGDIEEIRGVAVSANIIRTLLDREWIRVVGYRDVPGRPAMFATTKQFLDYFNLKSLQELPPLSEIKELSQSEQELDLADELAQQRVIDLPEEITDEASFEQSDAERAELLAEEEALELSKKPLDEILRMGMPESLLGEEADSALEDGVVPEPATQRAKQPADLDQTAEGGSIAPADDVADGDILGASSSREDLQESERSGPYDDHDRAGDPQAITGVEAHPATSAAEAMSEDSDEPAAGSDSEEPVAGR
ncbi:MAG: SMC-Scp complex subunit ScpB [Pseudomonadota bacterium]|nr:SMC-Scp complex subunit ScpB [Pseudomonadota bacterium]